MYIYIIYIWYIIHTHTHIYIIAGSRLSISSISIWIDRGGGSSHVTDVDSWDAKALLWNPRPTFLHCLLVKFPESKCKIPLKTTTKNPILGASNSHGIPMKLPFSPEFRFLNSNPRKLDMFSIWFPYDFPIFGASTPMNSSTQEPPTSCARIGRSSWQRYDSRDSVLMVTEVLGGAVDVMPYI